MCTGYIRYANVWQTTSFMYRLGLNLSKLKSSATSTSRRYWSSVLNAAQATTIYKMETKSRVKRRKATRVEV